MQLTEDNYYSAEANREYMSVSLWKEYNGTYGRVGCEFKATEKLAGRWTDEPNDAMLVGSYVDAWMDGADALKEFKATHPQLFTQKGELYAKYKKADEVIERIKRDDYFMKFIGGEHQVIMTANLFGSPWKIKMDSYLPGKAIVDLKVMSSITKLEWVRDIGYLDFVRYWGYDVQGAIYQKVVEMNTGKKLPFYLACATKEDQPDIQIIQITQNYLDEALTMVETTMPRILSVRNGEAEPDKCNTCDCCRYHKVLKAPISIADLTMAI